MLYIGKDMAGNDLKEISTGLFIASAFVLSWWRVGYRDTLRQVPAFQPYSSPLMTLTTGGVDYPVLPNGIVTLTP